MRAVLYSGVSRCLTASRQSGGRRSIKAQLDPFGGEGESLSERRCR